MKTGVYISRIIQNREVFREENNVTLGMKIMLKKDQTKEESGNCTGHYTKRFKVESAS